MQSLSVRVISSAEVSALLDYPSCVVAVESAMRRVSEGRALLPLRQDMRLPNGNGGLGMMPGYLAAPECFGIKLVSLFPGNAGLGLSSHLGLFVLYEAMAGRPLAVMEAGTLTAIRTAAASVVATRALARPEASVLAVIGTGEQARAHIEAFQVTRPFAAVRVWGRDFESALRIARDLDGLGGGRVTADADIRHVVSQADVVCTLTSAVEPILSGSDVRSGTHLCLVGASFPDRREVDDDCVAMARFIVDYRPSAMSQAGELLHAIQAGRVGEDHVAAEIGEVLSGTAAGRQSHEQVTAYKSLGVAAQDLAAAMLVYERAVALGRGTVATL